MAHNTISRTLSLALAVFIGCTEQHSRAVAVYPVDGQLLVQGKAATGATVTFHSVGPGTPSNSIAAKVNDEGHFIPVQPDGAIGLPEGTYALTAVWELDGKDQFGGRHADPNAPIAKVTVQNTVNLMSPIRLQ